MRGSACILHAYKYVLHMHTMPQFSYSPGAANAALQYCSCRSAAYGMLIYIWLTLVACICLGRALGLSLASGRLWEERCASPAEQAAASEALMARLLPHLAPPTTALLWLLLRLLLDEQARTALHRQQPGHALPW